MKKRILFIFIFFILLGLVAYFYINNVFLPVKFKSFVENHAQRFLHRDVTIGSIGYQPLKGITITDIRVFEDDDRKRLLVSSEELYFNILLAPIFKNKHIIIPAVHVVSPEIHIARGSDGAWNFQDILDRPKVKKGQDEYTVLMRKIEIEEGALEFVDLSREREFLETVSGLNIEVTLSIDKTVKFDLRAYLNDRNSKFNFDGEYLFEDKLLKTKLTYSNIPLVRYIKTYSPGLNLPKGMLSYGDLELNYTKNNLNVTGNTTLENIHFRAGSQTDIMGTFNITQAFVQWKDARLIAKANIDGLNSQIAFDRESGLTSDIDLEIRQLNYDSSGLNLAGTFKLANSLLKIGENQSFKGDINAGIKDLSYFEEAWRMTAGIDISDGTLNLGSDRRISTNLNTDKTQLTYNANGIKIISDVELVSPSARWDSLTATAETLKTDSVNLELKPEGTSLSLATKTDSLKTIWNGQYSLNGNPTISADLYLPKETASLPGYKVTVGLNGSTISGAPQVNTIEALNGELTIEPDLIITKKISAELNGIPVTVSGSIKDFSGPVADITLNAPSLDLAKVSVFYSAYTDKFGLTPSGLIDLNVDFNGTLADMASAGITAEAKLKNSAVTFSQNDLAVTEMTGKITFQSEQEQVSWTNFSGQFKDEVFSAEGVLTDFSRPVVNTTLKAGKIDLKTEANILRRAVQFTLLQGTYANSAFDIKGDAHFPEDDKPRADLRGTFELNLKDLRSLIPAQQERLEKYKLTGILNGRGLFKGKLGDFKNWQLTFDADTPQLSVMDTSLNNAVIKYGQRDQTISDMDISGNIYGGTLVFQSEIDLRTEDMPLKASAVLSDMNLAEFRKDKMHKSSQLAGTLQLEAFAQGPLSDTTKINGKGSMSITEGFLYHKSTREGVVGLLFIVPEVSDLFFTDAAANFTIRNNKLNLTDAVLVSKQVNMAISGWIDRDKSYDLTLIPEVSQTLLARSESAQKIPTTLLSQMVTYHCTGQIGVIKNKCSRESNPVNLLESTVGEAGTILKQGVGELLGDIFGK